MQNKFALFYVLFLKHCLLLILLLIVESLFDSPMTGTGGLEPSVNGSGNHYFIP